MNLLTLANDINAELAIIRSRNGHILSDQGRADIFNSIVTCLTDDLVNIIELAVVRKNHELLSWCYDLHDKKSIQRIGPNISEIAAQVSRVPDESHLTCQVQWSQTFKALDPQVRERILRNTLWDERRNKLELRAENPRDQKMRLLQKSINLGNLKSDLRSLESHTELVSSQLSTSIIESVQRCLLREYITGLQLLLTEQEQEEPIIEWGFEFRLDTGLIRQGPSIEKVLFIAKQLGGRSTFEIKPILSSIFETLSPEDKQSAMKGTIWQSHFQKRSKDRWWSR